MQEQLSFSSWAMLSASNRYRKKKNCNQAGFGEISTDAFERTFTCSYPRSRSNPWHWHQLHQCLEIRLDDLKRHLEVMSHTFINYLYPGETSAGVECNRFSRELSSSLLFYSCAAGECLLCIRKEKNLDSCRDCHLCRLTDVRGNATHILAT